MLNITSRPLANQHLRVTTTVFCPFPPINQLWKEKEKKENTVVVVCCLTTWIWCEKPGHDRRQPDDKYETKGPLVTHSQTTIQSQMAKEVCIEAEDSRHTCLAGKRTILSKVLIYFPPSMPFEMNSPFLFSHQFFASPPPSPSPPSPLSLFPSSSPSLPLPLLLSPLSLFPSSSPRLLWPVFCCSLTDWYRLYMSRCCHRRASLFCIQTSWYARIPLLLERKKAHV